MASLEVNSSADYTISGSGSLEGEGDFIKEGTGSVTFEASNKLKGVTYLKEGSIVMSKVSSDAVSDSLVLMGGTLNIGTDGKNNGVISFPIHIPEGVAGNISTSRYNYMESHISGKGDLHIYTAGERVYLGSKNAGAKMDGFEGNVYIHKLDKGLGSGQYGLILRGDGTYLPEADEDGNHGIVTNYFANTKVHLGSGTHLMSESKEFCYQIGELTCEDETATWWGYYKASSPVIYWKVGGLNTSVVFPGRICQPEKSTGANYKDQKSVIYKEGTGTYTFTHPNNVFTGGLFVQEGTVLLSEVEGSKGSEGMKGNPVSFYVEENGCLGGTGRITAGVSVKGKLAPGNHGIGTLRLSGIYNAETQSCGNEKAPITFYPGSVAEFELSSAENYDKLECNNSISFFANQDESNPAKIEIKVRKPFDIKDGDTFEIINAKNRGQESDYTYKYDIVYPEVEGLTFESEEVVVEGVAADPENEIEAVEASYKFIVKVKGSASKVNTISKENGINVYPVPAIDQITIDADFSKAEIIDNSGRVVAVTADKVVNVRSLQSGIYYVKAYTQEGTIVKRIVKK